MENNQINNTEQRVADAERVIERFMLLAVQEKHVGKNPACPMCQCVKEAADYAIKYYDIEAIKAQYGEELDEMMKNPKQMALACQH